MFVELSNGISKELDLEQLGRFRGHRVKNITLSAHEMSELLSSPRHISEMSYIVIDTSVDTSNS